MTEQRTRSHRWAHPGRLLVTFAVAALAASGLLVPSAPASAATTVTASASPRTLPLGETTQIRGRVPDAAPGAQVVLQRRTSTAWKTIDSAHTDVRQAYSFTVTPAKGHPRYRVTFPRQSGQPFAASDPVTLVVQWRPEISLALQWESTVDGGRRLTISGTTSYTGVGRVHLQQKYAGRDWSNAGFLTLDHGTFSGGPPHPLRPGNPIRVILGASGPRLQAISTPVTLPSPEPYHLTLNDPAGLTLPFRQTLTTVLIDAQAGDVVTLAFDGWVIEAPTVLDPDGASVAVTGPPARFRATKTGTYAVTFWVAGENDGAATVWASTPKVYVGEWGVPVDVAPDLPYQLVDVVYPGTAGQAFVAPAVGYQAQVRADGHRLTPWHTVDWRDIYVLDADGPVTYRIFESSPHQVLLGKAVDLTATIDGPPVPIDLGDGTDLALVSVDVPGGQPFFVDTYDINGADSAAFFGPDGNVTDWRQSDPVAGTYRIAVIADSCVGCSVQLTSPLIVDTPLDDPPVAVSTATYNVRWIWQTFTASAGDVVAVYQGYAGEASLVGPDGQLVAGEGGVWRIPATGQWQLRFDAYSWSGHLAARLVPVTTLAADGTPMTVTIAQPHEVHLVHVDVPVGATTQVTLDQVDASLDYGWVASAYAPDGQWYGARTTAGEFSFVASQPGGVDLIVRGQDWSNATGSLRLAVTTP